jgi:NhaA family Na+:H+ antiporter
VLALLGDRVSNGLRVFLLAIAIIDDILAIAIIAIFYTSDLDPVWLVSAVGFLMIVWGLRKWGITATWVYVLVGAAVWLAVFQSGVHATIAGVALGLMTPVGLYRGRPVHRKLEERLHPVSAYVVIPIFALANAGVDLRGGVLGESLGSTLTVAVAVSLVVGKLVGISTFTLGAVKFGIGSLPRGMRRVQVWGIAALGGIGFTVALFITELSFDHRILVDEAKVGIFLGSIVAGVLGLVLTARVARVGRPAADSD